jgi:hypothetical protein
MVGCRPRPTAPDVRTGQSFAGDGLAGMQVGPVRGKLQLADFGGDQGVFVGLRGSQGGGGAQLDQILVIEHAFNICGDGDSPPRLWRVAPTDNTLPIRTTPRRLYR